MFKKHGTRGHKQGFTLVEVIVVLVILAILAAILVPRLIGFIDQSKEKEAALHFSLMEKAVAASLSEVDASKIPALWIEDTNTPPGISDEQKFFIEKVRIYLNPDFPPTDWGGYTYRITINHFNSGEDKIPENLMKHTIYEYYPDGYDTGKMQYTYQNGTITKSVI